MAPTRSHPSSTASSSQSRTIAISKSLSWLLRHGATKERIPISADGYVKLSDVLNWGKLRAMHVDLREVVEVVQQNEKQRFGLRWDGVGKGEEGKEGEADSDGDGSVGGNDAEDLVGGAEEGKDDGEGQTPHLLALARLSSAPSPDPQQFSIRAVQGHSLKTIEATSLLTHITLENLPSACVHGTFFAVWPAILKSGGLKAMGRNHVHFATGPAVGDVLPRERGGRDLPEKEEEKGEFHLKAAMAKNAILSGMRGNAEVLIYVDVKRSIAEGKMEWYRSENGVILTEGIFPPEEAPPTELEETALMLEEAHVNGTGPLPKTRGNRASGAAYRQQQQQERKMVKTVCTEYWEIVIGIGVGVLWERGKGVVRDVPADLIRGSGKGSRRQVKAQARGKGKGSEKPKMRVERDDMDRFH